MIALVCALPYEIAPLLKKAKKEKYNGIVAYRAQVNNVPVIIYLCRPGLPHKNQLRRFLSQYSFTHVILTGFCGKLSGKVQRYGIVMPGKALFKSQSINVSGQGALHLRILSVQIPVTTLSEKADMHAITNADVIDMESFRFCEVLTEPEFSHLKFSICKIVDDLPHEEKYLQKDSMLRELPRAKSQIERLRVLFDFSWLDALYIRARRRKTSRILCRALVNLIKKL